MEYKKNEDGTDFLDEQGNKVPLEIIDDKKEDAKVIKDLVEELKESRLKLGLAEKLLEDSKKPPEVKAPLTDKEKLEAIVTEKLAEQAAANAQDNKKVAFEKFVIEHKEFHPDNDPTGLKRDALQRRFDSFNTSSLSKVEEFLSVIGDAKTLLLGNDSQLDTSTRNNLDSFPTPKGEPSGKRNEELTPKELKLIQITGKTKEQILKLKVKNPEFLAGLLQHVRD